MDYRLYKTEDFLTDESFINYCTEANITDVEFWTAIALEPELGKKIEEAKELYYTLSLKKNSDERKHELEKLKLRIESLEENVIPLVAEKRYFKLKQKSLWYSIAASFLVLIGFYVTFIKPNFESSATAYHFNVNDYKTLAVTAFNERRTVVLPDGSSVLMNGSSVLKISNNYNQKDRLLLLSGEAFFQVTKNKHKPFIVTAGKTFTTALGTSFKIKSYPDAATSSVMLSTGKVSVQTISKTNEGQIAILVPGEQVSLSKGKSDFIKSNFSPAQVEDWAAIKLVFQRATLEDIKLKLNEMYGVSVITMNTSKKVISFTGEFHNESLLQVLDAVGFSNHFRYEIKGNTVQIIFEH